MSYLHKIEMMILGANVRVKCWNMYFVHVKVYYIICQSIIELNRIGDYLILTSSLIFLLRS